MADDSRTDLHADLERGADGADVDIDALRRLGGTGAGGYYHLAEGVILARPLPGLIQDEESARRSLAEAHRLAEEQGRGLVLVLATDRMGSQDAAARRVWRKELDPELMVGVVFVSTSLLARAMGSFIIGLSRPPVPAQMVDTFTEAIERAREILAAREEISDG